MSSRRQNGWYHWIVLYVAVIVIFFFVLLIWEGCFCPQSNASPHKAQCPSEGSSQTLVE